ncbi:hypothetical protein [Litoribaculum gwangyangense]|uniref:DinB family protein n=1 Tax=Litoribaculum gwangyangense TaxID=1130722 RepID=A0ABP9CJ59_9FLAO
MNVIIKSTLKTLNQTKSLLSSLEDDVLSNSSVSPYYSSIGSHVRHILDFYDCIFSINTENKIDLTARSRNIDVESKCTSAEDYLDSIINKLKNFDFDDNRLVNVIDDLGSGKIQIPYTFGALFAQANSHTIHHYAIINYIANSLKITLSNTDFGYNPTTPKQVSVD